MIGWLEYGWMYFLRGGVVMWPLLLCSLVSLTLILERGAFSGGKIPAGTIPAPSAGWCGRNNGRTCWQ